MAIYGYARVSGRDQDLTAQIDALNAAGAAKVFSEKVSGAKTDRAELAKVLKRLGEGDPRPSLQALTSRHSRRCWGYRAPLLIVFRSAMLLSGDATQQILRSEPRLR